MSQRLLFLVFLMVFSACDLVRSPLDRNFDPKMYRVLQPRFLEKGELTEEELFLLNYAIVRHRDYFNYDLQGKTYREILALARQFESEGLPLEWKLPENRSPENIRTQIHNDGVGFVRLGKSSYLQKSLLFRCRFENPGAQDQALLNASFHFKGPFQDHLLTAGYEINCRIPARGYADLEFLVDGRHIQGNALFGNRSELSNLLIDSLLNRMHIGVADFSVARSIAHFDYCRSEGSSREPEWVFDYEEELGDDDWLEQGPDGRTIRIRLDSARYVDDF